LNNPSASSAKEKERREKKKKNFAGKGKVEGKGRRPRWTALTLFSVSRRLPSAVYYTPELGGTKE